MLPGFGKGGAGSLQCSHSVCRVKPVLHGCLSVHRAYAKLGPDNAAQLWRAPPYYRAAPALSG